jgi:hypothetical protein
MVDSVPAAAEAAAKTVAAAAIAAAAPAVQKEETKFNKFVTSIRWPLISFGAGVILHAVLVGKLF